MGKKMKSLNSKFTVNAFYILAILLTNIGNCFSKARSFESLERELESGVSWGILLLKIIILILSLASAYGWYRNGDLSRAVGTIFLGVVIFTVMSVLS